MTEQLQHIDKKLLEILDSVSDPEIPVLSIMEMGVVRSAIIVNGIVEVVITPTYSGCPAMDVIGDDIKSAFQKAGYEAKVELVLAPAWTTDWISEKGRANLKAYGIAPPENETDKSTLFAKPLIIPCPKCDSHNTKMVSEFGSTACKAHYQCNDCFEPFDYFKCLR
jgi:ring-1,2-phenylacetyl-CoA epoxidase subunit PaaD